MKAWKGALASAIATAAIALAVIAPLAQGGGKRHPGLKVVSVTSGFRAERATATCPRGYVAIGGGFFVATDPEQSFKLDRRRWRVSVSDEGPDPTSDAQAVCAKGTGGFELRDLGETD
jgi:hypothetical protein